MTIDMTQFKKGDRLRCADGSEAIYLGGNKVWYCHSLDWGYVGDNGKATGKRDQRDITGPWVDLRSGEVWVSVEASGLVQTFDTKEMAEEYQLVRSFKRLALKRVTWTEGDVE